MRPDYLRLMIDESGDLADFLQTLSDDEWRAPTLCRGWSVVEVVSHMVVGHTTPVVTCGLHVARRRFDVDRTSYELARSYAGSHDPGRVLAAFRAATQGPPRAAARLVPVHELFTDHLVHHQDIRRPLGRPRTLPPERAAAALIALPRLSRRVGSRRRLGGLRLCPTDAEVTVGAGSVEVHGPAEAMIMAATGREAALSDLAGPGAAVLAARLSRPPTAELTTVDQGD